MKDIAVFVLSNGEHIIAQYDQLDTERMMLYNSYKVDGVAKVSFSVFPRYNASVANEHVMYNTALYTIIEPDSSILIKYISKVGDKLVPSEPVKERKVAVVEPVEFPVYDYSLPDGSLLRDDLISEDVDYIEED